MQGVSQIAQTRAELGFARQPDALGVGEAVGFATELFQENAFSSWRYSITACWCRLIQPATAMSRNWSCVVTEWRIFQKSLWLNTPSGLG